MKVVINTCIGGFSLSDKAHELLKAKGHNPWDFAINDELRAHPDLIEIVETLGEEANGKYATLKILEIPDSVQWRIREDLGIEYIVEKSRTWSHYD